MPKKNEVGDFTVEYILQAGGRTVSYHYEHDIRATSRTDLLAKARAKCPQGMSVKSISRQHFGTTRMWYKLKGVPDNECWSVRACMEAFGK